MVNLYSLEEAQGETRLESINTHSNRNQGRKLFRRREDKEQCLKQRQEKFLCWALHGRRTAFSIRHLAEMGYHRCQATLLPLCTPHLLLMPHKAGFSLCYPALLCFTVAPPRFSPTSRFTWASCTELPQHALEGLIKQIEMHLGLWLDN